MLGEAQRATSPRRGIFLAALLFGAIHLPNPFLAPVTAVAALVWCRLYDRYPNIIPLALSHALGTLAVRYAFDDVISDGCESARHICGWICEGMREALAPEIHPS